MSLSKGEGAEVTSTFWATMLDTHLQQTPVPNFNIDTEFWYATLFDPVKWNMREKIGSAFHQTLISVVDDLMNIQSTMLFQFPIFHACNAKVFENIFDRRVGEGR